MVFDEEINYQKEVIKPFSYQEIITELASILPKKDFDIVIYRLIYQLDWQEIASVCQEPRSTVHWRYQEAIKKAQKAFKK